MRHNGKDFKIVTFSQVIRFMDKFYRFPNFIMVGSVKVLKDDILRIYKEQTGNELTWYKRAVCRAELCRVSSVLKAGNVNG